MLHGIDTLADAVRVTLGPKGRNVLQTRQVVRRTTYHQGRGHRRQGDRARGQVREYGRIAGVKAPGFGDRRKAMLEDIAILTGYLRETQSTFRKVEKIEKVEKVRGPPRT